MASKKNLNSNSKANFNNESSADIKQDDGDNAATTNDQALAIEDQQDEQKVQPALGKKDSQPAITTKESKHDEEYEKASAEIAVKAEQSRGETEGAEEN
jgi:hypothetical protein